MNPPPLKPLFQVRAEVRDSHLLIRYAVANPSPRDLYLYTREVIVNGRIDETPGLKFDPESRVITAHMLPYFFVYAGRIDQPSREIATPVRAGKRFAHTVQVALPARELRIGTAVGSCRERASRYRGLRFVVDLYLWSNPDVTERTERIGGVEVIEPIFPPTTASDGGELMSPVIPLDIPALECAPT